MSVSFLDIQTVALTSESPDLSSVPRNAPAANLVMSGEVIYNHFVFRFDFKDWKVIKENLTWLYIILLYPEVVLFLW